MTSALSVEASTIPDLGIRPGASPRAALHALVVQPIPIVVAKTMMVRHHYLHSLPGGTHFAFGVFVGSRLLGALTFGVRPKLVHCIVEDAAPVDCLTLSRLWLSDDLPRNSESRALGVVLRGLRRDTRVKFLVSYADPGRGHVGTIYQATEWLYTGLSSAMPLYDLGDGRVHHSRSLSHGFGTHSVRHFASHGVAIRVIPQAAKHRYVYFLDPSWRPRLKVQVLPYPKREVTSASS